MSFLEWRRFNFFDLHKDIDGGKILESLEDTTITAVCSGNGQLVIGDSNGWVHLVSRSWTVTTFKAYDINLSLAEHLKHDPFLVTVGEDEPGVNPILKVWDTCRLDRHGSPVCVRVTRAIPSHMRPTTVTALTIHEDKNMMAVGFADGSVVLLRGDIARQRNSKMKTLTNMGNTPITGLAFKDANHLFVSSRSSVLIIYLSGSWSAGSERAVVLDAGSKGSGSGATGGCKSGCAVLADTNFMVARSDAIYCYTTDGIGPCYALEGDKKRLDWFRSYLVITTISEKDQRTTSDDASPHKTNQITILDIQNMFIVFTCSLNEVEAVVTEWGAFYLLTKDKKIHHLDEKDLQSKLTLLFKKNLYDVAIKMASSQQYDSDGLMDIYKQYGDHLYMKGDQRGAIEQYMKTIGRLETSYVIRKYLDSRHLEPLTRYLQELHKKGLATEDHTTLLLTCFVKLDQHDQEGKLREFINTKDRNIHFDVEIAIKVCRQVSIDDALHLSRSHNHHDWYLKIVIEDKKDFRMALDYISDLDFDDADLYMKKYGNILIQNVPEESTQFLKRLCTDYHPKTKPLVSDDMLTGIGRKMIRARPEDYIHLFLNNSHMLVNFLEHMVKADTDCSSLIYNTLIEHYIHVWSTIADDSPQKLIYEQNVMKILQNPNANYDKDQTLIICQMLSFKQGILYLYEEKKLFAEIVRYHMLCGDGNAAMEVCRRGASGGVSGNGALWLEMLWWPPSKENLGEVLNVIANERLLSPMLVIDCLSSTTSCTLGDVRKYLMNILKTEIDLSARESELATKYRSETQRIRSLIDSMTTKPVTFQGSRCAACHHQLELPTVHFLCQHSYHQHCFQSFAESESECPACAPQNATLRASLYPPAASAAGGHSVNPANTAEALHARLDREADGFSVVSEYFGRGLFNKLTLITDPVKPQTNQVDVPFSKANEVYKTNLEGKNDGTNYNASKSPAYNVDPDYHSYGPGAEAKLRLQEGISKQVYISENNKQPGTRGSSSVIPTSEGRMRLLEQRRAEMQYSSSLEANMNRTLHPDLLKSQVTQMHTSNDIIDRSPRATPRHKILEKKKDNFEAASLPNSISSSPKISGTVLSKNPSLVSSNPFDEDEYDDSKNPFGDETDSKNPFSEDDNYNESLNPFA